MHVGRLGNGKELLSLQNKQTYPRCPDAKALPCSTHVQVGMGGMDPNRNSGGFAQEKARKEAATWLLTY